MSKDFLKRPRKLRSVQIEAWDRAVFVPKMTARELADVSDAQDKIKKDNPGKMGDMIYLALVVFTYACNEDGSKVFAAEDKDSLMDQPYEALNTVAQALLDHNGLGADKTPGKSAAAEPAV